MNHTYTDGSHQRLSVATTLNFTSSLSVLSCTHFLYLAVHKPYLGARNTTPKARNCRCLIADAGSANVDTIIHGMEINVVDSRVDLC